MVSMCIHVVVRFASETWYANEPFAKTTAGDVTTFVLSWAISAS